MPTANHLIQNKTNLAVRLVPIWLLVATCSIVFIEPAPYDVLLIVLCITYFAFGLRIPPGMGVGLFLMGIYVFANLLSSMFSEHPPDTLGYMVISIFLVITWIFFTCVIYQDPKRFLDTIWNGYIVAALIASILGILAYYAPFPGSLQFLKSYSESGAPVEGYGLRVRGPFKDPNVLGAFLVPAALYLIYKLENAARSRIVITLAFLTIVLAIFLSFSRGAWVNLAVSAFLYLCMSLAISHSKADTYRVVMITAVVLICCIGITVTALSNKSTSKLLHERTEVQDYDTGHHGRFDVLGIILYDAFLYPVGFGPGQSLERVHASLPPHNLYVHILAETGWLGGIAICCFLLLTLWRSFFFCLHQSNLQKAYIVVFVCVIGMLLESLIIHSTHWRHLYMLLAMLWGPMLGKEKCYV